MKMNDTLLLMCEQFVVLWYPGFMLTSCDLLTTGNLVQDSLVFFFYFFNILDSCPGSHSHPNWSDTGT